MKNLAEKKLLVSMMQALGQPVDPALLESIRIEEELTSKLFPKQEIVLEEIVEKVEENIEEPVEEIQEKVEIEKESEVIVEIAPPQPAKTQDLVAKSVEAITKLKPTPQTPQKEIPMYDELKHIRRQLEDIQKRYSTLAWGSGGGGSVLIRDMSDFIPTSVGPGKYMTWNNGMFYMDDVNTNEVTYNTTLVTSNAYTAQPGDYYIGVNYAGPVTITLPNIATSGRNLIIKDESGNCENNAITILGTIDNDVSGAILQLNNGGIDLIFRDGWRII